MISGVSVFLHKCSRRKKGISLLEMTSSQTKSKYETLRNWITPNTNNIKSGETSKLLLSLMLSDSSILRSFHSTASLCGWCGRQFLCGETSRTKTISEGILRLCASNYFEVVKPLMLPRENLKRLLGTHKADKNFHNSQRLDRKSWKSPLATSILTTWMCFIPTTNTTQSIKSPQTHSVTTKAKSIGWNWSRQCQ